MRNVFVKNFEELFLNISDDIKKEGHVSLYLESKSKESIFEKLLIQELKRNIDGKDVILIAIRNIELKPEFKSKKLFTNFVKNLELLKSPIIFHDLINERLVKFLSEKKYLLLEEKKYGEIVRSMYKMNW